MLFEEFSCGREKCRLSEGKGCLGECFIFKTSENFGLGMFTGGNGQGVATNTWQTYKEHTDRIQQKRMTRA
jgi:hypothetical protein